jgi:hypothetical protein
VTPASSPPAPPRQQAKLAGAAPFRAQANSFLPRVSKLTPVISILLLLVVILIPCAAAAVTRYKRLR